jgi:hypothetical protein
VSSNSDARSGLIPMTAERGSRRLGIPDLDAWLADPALCVAHRRQAAVAPARLWRAARTVRLADTRVLGRLVRWRIPGVASAAITYDELFRAPPFTVLEEQEHALICGLVGRIWQPGVDCPRLSGPEEFCNWSGRKSARVLFGIWVTSVAPGTAALISETRVGVSDRAGRLGLEVVRPLIVAFHSLIGSEALDAAVRSAACAGGGGDDGVGAAGEASALAGEASALAAEAGAGGPDDAAGEGDHAAGAG